jgi:hypothetical protein
MTYKKQLRLVDSIVESLREQLKLGIRDFIFEANVSDLVCKTVKVTVNPNDIKGTPLTPEETNHILVHVEKMLWNTLSLQKGWFTVMFKVVDGQLLDDCVVRFTESKGSTV